MLSLSLFSFFSWFSFHLFCKFGSVGIDMIMIRPNLYISSHDDKSNLYPWSYFHSLPLVVSRRSLIVDDEGKTIAVVLNDIVSPQLLQQLELVASQYRDAVIHRLLVSDVRGAHATVMFGSYIEWGGSGKIFTKKTNESCPNFLESIDGVGKFLSHMFKLVCREIATCIQSIPEELHLWEAITLITNITTRHTDPCDFTWSMVLPFGVFTSGAVDLKYMNTILKCRRGGLYFINFSKIYHELCTSSSERQALICTNHRAVVKRYVNCDISHL
jgi:hypothetical protein